METQDIILNNLRVPLRVRYDRYSSLNCGASDLRGSCEEQVNQNVRGPIRLITDKLYSYNLAIQEIRP